MTLDTDFNVVPYFDDYDETKDFYRILFKPAVAVQARELTQLQTIINQQAKRFGDALIKEGSVISGGNFVEVNPLPYVKILDSGTDQDGDTVSISVDSYVGMKAVGQSTGIEAIIVETTSGLESRAPDLNTLHVKYINNAQDASNNNVGTFSSSEEIQIQRLNANNVYEDYHVVTAGGSVDGSAIGNGYGVRCGDGLIYQKGFCVRFTDDLTIVSKYSTTPDDVVVGFQTAESIVDSDDDSSLLDNATGFNNENAPGADRLKLSPSLVVKTLAEAEADERFFAIQEYVNGRVVRRNLINYKGIQSLIEQRTAEESGNYTVNDFKLTVANNSSNTDLLTLNVGSGVAYVEGRRVELLDTIDLTINKATEFEDNETRDIATNYGHYLIANTMLGDFAPDSFSIINLEDSGKSTIGTARIRNIEKSGSNYKIYLFDISMSSNEVFSDVRYISRASGGTANATISLTSGAPQIFDGSFLTPIYELGNDAVKDIDTSQTDYIFRKIDRSASVSATGEIVITLASGTLPYSVGALNSSQLSEILVIADGASGNVVTGEVIELASGTVNSTTQMTLQAASGGIPDAPTDVVVYFNAKKSNFSPKTKSIETVYVKFDVDTYPPANTGMFTLGFPDVISIDNVWVNSTYTTSNDSSSGFELFKNQNDTHYGLSILRKKGSTSLPAGSKLLVKLKTFRQTSGNTFFCVDSYSSVIDDVSETLPAGKIRTQDIPLYQSSGGKKYDLRNCIDFRPYAANTANYSASAGSATVNPSSTLTFNATENNFPSANKLVECVFDYYLPRNDLLAISEFGKFYVIEGIAGDTAIPSAPSKGMVLASIKVPPFPSLPASVANQSNKPKYAVEVKKRKTKNYTMRDIGQLEERIDQIEYYTSLSILERETNDLLVTDSNGLTRFKNGILVDSFKDFSIADVTDAEFNAAIDASYEELSPKFRAIPIDLKVFSTSSATDHGSTVTLSGSDVSLISQPYATKSRSCVTDLYNFKGIMALNPSYDAGVDTTRSPDINITTDIGSILNDYTDQLAEFLPIQRTQRDVVQNTLIGTTSTLGLNSTSLETSQVGDFITDISVNPFLRSRNVEVTVTGLRPNTRFYFYFDKTDVNAHVATATLANGTINRTSDFSASVPKISDSNGVLRAIFRIPEGTFNVGDRTLEVADVSTYASIDSATSYAAKRYSGFNFSIDKAGVSVSTRVPDPIVASPNITSIPENQGNPPDDPIAQTFIISKDSVTDFAAIVPKIDLFFNSKSSNTGVTVQIREVFNGFPTKKVVPFSSVHLDSSEINANTTSASVATTVTFDSPIALRTDVEYAIVVKPDGNSPDYRVWVAETGGTDVDSGLAITRDSNAGLLFTSTNNRTWTPYQDENMKFKVYRNEFSAASGNVILTNKDHEFLKVTDVSSTTFIQGERVFVNSANTLSGTVAIVEGNTTVIGSNTTFTTDFEVGEHMIVEYASGSHQISEILSISSDTELVLKEPMFNSNTAASYQNTPIGTVATYISATPSMLVLENSSAKSGLVFEANTSIMGESSGATATIESVHDQEMSYCQPTIARINFDRTRTFMSANSVWDGSSTFQKNMVFTDANYFNSSAAYIRSRSNEIVSGSGKTFKLAITLSDIDGAGDISPIIDHAASNILLYQSLINNDSTDEYTRDGNATSKYVSKSVELADGLDAEDIKVFLTAYRPSGSDIKVYAKLKSASDSTIFENIAWTELELKDETNSYSSPANRYDYKELEYNIPEDVRGNGEGAYLVDDEIVYFTTNGAKHTDYKVFAIKIVMLGTDHSKIPRVKDMRALAVS